MNRLSKKLSKSFATSITKSALKIAVINSHDHADLIGHIQVENTDALIDLLKTPDWRLSYNLPNLAALDLSGMDFSGKNLSNIEFTGCRLRHAKLVNATLEFAEVYQCDFTGTDFTSAHIRNTDFCTGGFLSLSDNSDTFVQYAPPILDNAVFDRATLSHNRFASTRMQNTSFKGATLNRVHFIEPFLDHADFSGATLLHVTAKNLDLSNSKITAEQIQKIEGGVASTPSHQALRLRKMTKPRSPSSPANGR